MPAQKNYSKKFDMKQNITAVGSQIFNWMCAPLRRTGTTWLKIGMS